MATSSASGPLPLLPLRGVSILPGLTAPVDLSRQSPAMQAVRRAGDRKSQAARSAAGEPARGRLVVGILRENTATPDLDQLYPVGIVCEVVQVLPGTPGRMSVVLRGIGRVRLLDLYSERDHLVVRFETAVDTMRTSTLAYAYATKLLGTDIADQLGEA